MQNISQNLATVQRKMDAYVRSGFGNQAGKITLRFINTNFRNQSWAGPPNMPWHPRRKTKKAWQWANSAPKGKARRGLLVRDGHLRNSFTATTAPGAVTIASNIPYAKAHNEGFNGAITQTVKAHKRKVTTIGIAGIKTLKKKSNITFGRVDTGNTQDVKEHTRTINQHIPRRQFMPTQQRPSAELTRQITRQVTLDIMKILKP